MFLFFLLDQGLYLMLNSNERCSCLSLWNADITACFSTPGYIILIALILQACLAISYWSIIWTSLKSDLMPGFLNIWLSFLWCWGLNAGFPCSLPLATLQPCCQHLLNASWRGHVTFAAFTCFCWFCYCLFFLYLLICLLSLSWLLEPTICCALSQVSKDRNSLSTATVLPTPLCLPPWDEPEECLLRSLTLGLLTAVL